MASGLIRRFGIIIVIIVIAVFAFLFRDRLSGSAAELKVGDCFDVPTVLTDIKDVQHHPCTDAHTGEVFAVVTDPAASDAAPPDENHVLTFITTACLPVLTTYIAEDATTQTTIDFGTFYPSDADWKTGNRSYTCYLYRVDKGPMTTTLKGAKP